MPKNYLTDSFRKLLRRREFLLKNLVKAIGKDSRGIGNFIQIYSPRPGWKVLKAYLYSKKFRAAILLCVDSQIYIPFLIAHKASKVGWNMSKYSEEGFSSKIENILRDIDDDKYEVFEIN